MVTMTKPTFILFAGIGWAGTTSLYYTLCDIGYLHGGFNKEYRYLSIIDGKNPKALTFLTQTQRYLFHVCCPHIIALKLLSDINTSFGFYLFLNHLERLDKIFKYIHSSITIEQNNKEAVNAMKLRTREFVYNLREVADQYKKGVEYQDSEEQYIFPNQIDAITKFTDEDIDYIFTNPSLEKYAYYYKKVWEYNERKFPAVTDWTNGKQGYSIKSLIDIKTALEPHFDVKALIMLRDPIRRAFSFVNSYYTISKDNSEFYNTYRSRVEELTLDYTKFINNWKEVFGDKFHYVIMEDFFNLNQNEEREKLEKFLDYKIPKDKLFPCVFVPDKGINALHIEGVKDQWRSDTFKLPEKDYNILRYTTCSQVYKNFKKLHGYLPADWGRPIDYGYND